MEVAIGILKGNPDKESPALREWAINIVNANSPVQLDPKVREELKRKPLRSIRVIQPARPKVAEREIPKNAVTDEKGNVVTDENGNILTFEDVNTIGETVTSVRDSIISGTKPHKR